MANLSDILVNFTAPDVVRSILLASMKAMGCQEPCGVTETFGIPMQCGVDVSLATVIHDDGRPVVEAIRRGIYQLAAELTRYRTSAGSRFRLCRHFDDLPPICSSSLLHSTLTLRVTDSVVPASLADFVAGAEKRLASVIDDEQQPAALSEYGELMVKTPAGHFQRYLPPRIVIGELARSTRWALAQSWDPHEFMPMVEIPNMVRYDHNGSAYAPPPAPMGAFWGLRASDDLRRWPRAAMLFDRLKQVAAKAAILESGCGS